MNIENLILKAEEAKAILSQKWPIVHSRWLKQKSGRNLTILGS